MRGQLNADAKEWRPTGGLASFILPESTNAESTGPGGGGNDEAEVSRLPMNGSVSGGSHSSTPERHSAYQWSSMCADPPPYFPSFALGGCIAPSTRVSDTSGSALEGVDWKKEFQKVMDLTRSLIEKQLNTEHGSAGRSEASDTGAEKMGTNDSSLRGSPQAASSLAPFLSPEQYPELPRTDAAKPSQSGKWVNVVASGKAKQHSSSSDQNKSEHNSGRGTIGQQASGDGATSNAADDEFDENGRPLPPLTANGNRRWKKPTKAQQKREAAQKNAFEAFANALLHTVSPFMAPLRERCKTSLPHIKVDQRFGKSGQPHTAVAQFVVAPLVTNYRPRHFHDLTPGDLMEFHYDFAQVLKQLKSAEEILFGYGAVWKRYAVPYCYVNCREYREEVLSLCPDEVPNIRVEAIYEDDIIKDISDVVLSVEELEPLQNLSFLQAMGRRINLAPLFDAFDAVFQPIENYRIIIRNLHSAPSTYLIQASRHEIGQKPQPLVLYNDPSLWDDLPTVSRIRVEPTIIPRAPQGNCATGEENMTSTQKGGNDLNCTKRKKTPSEGASGFGIRWSNTGFNLNDLKNLEVAVPLVSGAICVVVAGIVLWRGRGKR
uniref:WGS project CAEQ00000000 data, annotated contig 1909 n=1 Tax=Trypanosoma congolense (strain IL3000) TaxID=1068625 RepID=F9W9X5_TRYCI|nr:unnamed protein product [Trypanosoma congolense IL3000]